MKTLVTIVLTFIVSALSAQNLKGIATYKSQTKLEMKKDSSMNDEMFKQIQALMAKQMQKEYTLKFNGQEATYKQAESLNNGPATASSGGMTISVVVGNEDEILYRNLKSLQQKEQKEIMGKTFLVQEDLKKDDWTLTKETKNIGQYVCFKATRTFDRTSFKHSFSNGKDGKSEEVKKTINVEAWYTPQIPLGHGPGSHWGLPGLILEVSSGNTTLLCSKIVLNSKKELNISAPTKGKKVTAAEFKAISDKKNKEMISRMKSGRKDGHSFGFTIEN
jgi:GLPGLI family protein